MIIFVQNYQLLRFLLVITNHHLLHLWPYTHAWQFLEDNIGNLTQGHKYRVVPANNIGDFDPCNTRYDNILIRILWMSLILMVVLASLTGVRTMLKLHGHHRSLMSKLRLPIILLNKRNRGYYYLNEKVGTLDHIRWDYVSYAHALCIIGILTWLCISPEYRKYVTHAKIKRLANFAVFSIHIMLYSRFVWYTFFMAFLLFTYYLSICISIRHYYYTCLFYM